MPDADKKPQQKPLAEAAGKSVKPAKGENPFTGIKNMLGELHHRILGIGGYKSHTSSTPPPPKHESSTTKISHHYSNVAHNLTQNNNSFMSARKESPPKELVIPRNENTPKGAGIQAMKEMVTRATQAASVDEKSVRASTPGITAKERSRGLRKPFPATTVADREAVTQLASREPGKTVPAAAQLAKLLKAADSAKSGQNQTSFERSSKDALVGMAKDVRAGKKREVADVISDPKSKGASLIKGENSPNIARMIDQHQTLAQTIHSSKLEREKHLTSTEGKNPKTINHYKASDYHVSGLDAPQGSPAALEKDMAPELAHMMATNDDDHVKRVDAYENEQSKQESRKGRVTPHSSEKPSKVMEHNLGPKPEGKASQVMSEAASVSKGAGKSSTIEGTLKMVSSNGQPLGEAIFEGVRI